MYNQSRTYLQRNNSHYNHENIMLCYILYYYKYSEYPKGITRRALWLCLDTVIIPTV